MSEELRERSFEIPTAEGLPASNEEGGENPLKMVLDRMHGRWTWAIVLGCVLGAVLSIIGYKVGPVTYQSTAILAVEARMETLVEETPETREIRVDQEVQEQAQLLRAPQVLQRAIRSPELLAYQQSGRPNVAEQIAANLKVTVPRGAAIIVVSLTDPDPQFAAKAVNAIVGSYEETFQPNRDEKFQSKVTDVQKLINATRLKIDNHKRERIDILRDSRYGLVDPEEIRGADLEEQLRLESQLNEIDSQLAQIREATSLRVRQSLEAEGSTEEPTEDMLAPRLGDRVEPSVNELASVDPELPRMQEELHQEELRFDLVQQQFGSKHMAYRRALANFTAKQSSFDTRFAAAMKRWETSAGSQFTWGALTERRKSLSNEYEALRTKRVEQDLAQLKAEELDEKIASETEELRRLNARQLELDREKVAIRKGRVDTIQPAVPPITPSKNRQMSFAAAGALGGFGFSLAVFFLVGTVDQKTFGVSQLEDSRNSMRVLGVMPNMDETEEDGEMVILATDCVHRIRARLEARRSPERGYAMMVSSPFQGDGKTTLAVGLGWSYAESGYKTLLLDADFIGRAMSHQFGHLRDPGLREIIRNGEVADEIKELGHPNLNLLSIGFDRRISAANLSPRLMSRVLDSVRDQYDLIIIDSGPITASIEAMPVASAADGVVLALRRGRSRARLAECISDVRGVGADYLGLVLNYADKRDCIRHGSTSRMSLSVQAALESGDATALPAAKNPLVGGMTSRED